MIANLNVEARQFYLFVDWKLMSSPNKLPTRQLPTALRAVPIERVDERPQPLPRSSKMLVYHEFRWHLILWALAPVILAIGTVLVWLG